MGGSRAGSSADDDEEGNEDEGTEDDNDDEEEEEDGTAGRGRAREVSRERREDGEGHRRESKAGVAGKIEEGRRIYVGRAADGGGGDSRRVDEGRA